MSFEADFWQVYLIPEFDGEKQENGQEFKANLSYIVGLRPTSTSWTLSKKKENESG